MHAADKIPDLRLKALTLSILKLTGLAEEAVREANVFDDDEFQLYNFGFLMAQNKTVTSIINSLKLLEDEITKEQKSNNVDENLPGLLARVRFIKSVLSILNILTRIDMMENGKLDDKIHQNFQHATQSLKQIGETRKKLSVTHKEDNVTLPLGFEPLFNQHLLPPTFQREHKEI